MLLHISSSDTVFGLASLELRKGCTINKKLKIEIDSFLLNLSLQLWGYIKIRLIAESSIAL